MKLSSGINFAMCFTLAFAVVVNADEIKLKPQELCPVMDAKINREVYRDQGGKRIYFCCTPCIEKFNVDPEEYLQKMETQGFAPVNIPNPQRECPVMGGEINRDIFSDYEGKRIYFCCPGCTTAFKADPAKYLRELISTGIDLEDTPSLSRYYRGASEGEKDNHQH